MTGRFDPIFLCLSPFVLTFPPLRYLLSTSWNWRVPPPCCPPAQHQMPSPAGGRRNDASLAPRPSAPGSKHHDLSTAVNSKSPKSTIHKEINNSETSENDIKTKLGRGYQTFFEGCHDPEYQPQSGGTTPHPTSQCLSYSLCQVQPGWHEWVQTRNGSRTAHLPVILVRQRHMASSWLWSCTGSSTHCQICSTNLVHNK